MKAIILVTLLGTVFTMQSQTLPDKEFVWEETEGCVLDSAFVIYAKAEIDPVIHSVSEAQFQLFLNSLIIQLDEGTVVSTSSTTGYIKLKLVFIPGYPVCVSAIGTKDLSLLKIQKDAIRAQFKKIKGFTPCYQGGKIQVCEGKVLMTFANGTLTNWRVINFSLVKE